MNNNFNNTLPMKSISTMNLQVFGKVGDAPCTYLGSEIWSRQDCLKSREGEVIRATVFLYLYELIFSHKFSND